MPGLFSWMTGSVPTVAPEKEPGWTWVTRAEGGRHRPRTLLSASKNNRPLCPPLLHASHTPSTEKNCGMVLAGDIPALEKEYLHQHHSKKALPLGELLFRRFSSAPPEAGVRTPSALSVNNADKKKYRKHKSHDVSRRRSKSPPNPAEGDSQMSVSADKRFHHSQPQTKSKEDDTGKKLKHSDLDSELSLKNASSKDSDLSGSKDIKGSVLNRKRSKEKTALSRTASKEASKEKVLAAYTTASKQVEMGMKKPIDIRPRFPSLNTRVTPKPPEIEMPVDVSRKSSTEHSTCTAQDSFTYTTTHSTSTPLRGRPPRIPSPKAGPTTTENLSQRPSSLSPVSRKISGQNFLPASTSGSGAKSKDSPLESSWDSLSRKPSSACESAGHLDQPALQSPGSSKMPSPKASSLMSGPSQEDGLSKGRAGPPNPPLHQRGRSYDTKAAIAENASKIAGEVKDLSKKNKSTGRVSRRDDFKSKHDGGEQFQQALATFYAVNKPESSLERNRKAKSTSPSHECGKKTTLSQQKDSLNATPSLQRTSSRTPPEIRTPLRTPPAERTPTTSPPPERVSITRGSVGYKPSGSLVPEQRTGLAPPEIPAPSPESVVSPSTVVDRKRSLTPPSGEQRKGGLLALEQRHQDLENLAAHKHQTQDLISQAIYNDNELAKRAGTHFQTMMGRILSHDPAIFSKPRPDSFELEPGQERQTKLTRQTRKQVTKSVEMKGLNQNGEEQTTLFSIKEQGCRIQHQDSAHPEKNVDQTMTRNVRSVTKEGSTTISMHRQELETLGPVKGERPATHDQKCQAAVGKSISPPLWNGRMSPTLMSERLKSPHRKHGSLSERVSPTPKIPSPVSQAGSLALSFSPTGSKVSRMTGYKPPINPKHKRR